MEPFQCHAFPEYHIMCIYIYICLRIYTKLNGLFMSIGFSLIHWFEKKTKWNIQMFGIYITQSIQSIPAMSDHNQWSACMLSYQCNNRCLKNLKMWHHIFPQTGMQATLFINPYLSTQKKSENKQTKKTKTNSLKMMFFFSTFKHTDTTKMWLA